MRILLIDDHVLFTKSLKIALEDNPEIEELSTLTDINEIMEYIQVENPDIILMDINLTNISKEDGLSLAKKIIEAFNDIKIVFLTGFNLPVYRYEAKKMGAKGFIDKNIDPENLIEILSNVNKGFTFFPNSGYVEALTEREKEILQLLANGKKRKDVAARLYLSERTVSNHLQHVFSKLEVSSSVEAVSKGIQLGYILPEKRDK